MERGLGRGYGGGGVMEGLWRGRGYGGVMEGDVREGEVMEWRLWRGYGGEVMEGLWRGGVMEGKLGRG